MAKSNYLYKIYHSKLELEAKNHKNCCKFHFITFVPNYKYSDDGKSKFNILVIGCLCVMFQ